jgi:hypothetical protein
MGPVVVYFYLYASSTSSAARVVGWRVEHLEAPASSNFIDAMEKHGDSRAIS